MICRYFLQNLDPETAQKVHAWAMDIWLLNILLVWFLPHWLRIPYLIVVSIYANFVGHWSGLSAERPSEVFDD